MILQTCSTIAQNPDSFNAARPRRRTSFAASAPVTKLPFTSPNESLASPNHIQSSYPLLHKWGYPGKNESGPAETRAIRRTYHVVEAGLWAVLSCIFRWIIKCTGIEMKHLREIFYYCCTEFLSIVLDVGDRELATNHPTVSLRWPTWWGEKCTKQGCRGPIIRPVFR